MAPRSPGRHARRRWTKGEPSSDLGSLLAVSDSAVDDDKGKIWDRRQQSSPARLPPGCPRMAAPQDRASFLELLRKSELLPTPQMEQLATDASLPADAEGVAETLIRHDLLTSFQARLLLAGRFRGLILDRHRDLSRRVALETLRTDLMNVPGVRERFAREGRAIAALDPPTSSASTSSVRMATSITFRGRELCYSFWGSPCWHWRSLPPGVGHAATDGVRPVKRTAPIPARTWRSP